MNRIRYCPIGWGCRIHRLYRCREVSPTPQRVSRYDMKQSQGEVIVMLELREMRSTLSFPSLPGPLWPSMVALDRVLSMDQIELNCVLTLNWIVWNRTVFDIETVLTLNWIVSNRTILTINCLWTKTLTYTQLNRLNLNCLTKLNRSK